ncbi:unnamed protein product [Linum trigynum]|uniref:Uncharacterized protein n=1 Tax=Linum trigynum TaxID=586398 RepID=A0AAV2CHE1_9ROSI
MSGDISSFCRNIIPRIWRRDEPVQDSDMITGFTYRLPEWQNSVLFHYVMPIVDDDGLNVLFDFMAQNSYCLGAKMHAEIRQADQGEDETWSVPSDHDYDDEDEEEGEDGEEEQHNYPPYFYLQVNEEDDELSYVDSYGVIPMAIVTGFEEEFYKGQIFHSKQAAQVAVKHHAYNATFSMAWWSRHLQSRKLDA